MLQDQLLIILALLFVTSMLALVSERFRISYPILLVLVGLAISFLPPLLYAAAWTISWASFGAYAGLLRWPSLTQLIALLVSSWKNLTVFNDNPD